MPNRAVSEFLAEYETPASGKGTAIQEFLSSLDGAVGNTGYNIFGGVKDMGKLVYDIPVRAKGALGKLFEDEYPGERQTWTDRWREKDEARTERRQQEMTDSERGEKVFPSLFGVTPPITRGDIADASASTGYSLVGMGFGLAGGAAGTVLSGGNPLVGAAAGVAASAAPLTKMSMTEGRLMFIEAANDAREEQNKPRLSIGEEKKLLDALNSDVVKHALWESGPEALSNVLAISGIGNVFKGASKYAVGKMAMGLAKIYGGELATETTTELGQHPILRKHGLAEGELTVKEAFDRIYPATMVISTGMGGGAALAGAGYRATRGQGEDADQQGDLSVTPEPEAPPLDLSSRTTDLLRPQDQAAQDQALVQQLHEAAQPIPLTEDMVFWEDYGESGVPTDASFGPQAPTAQAGFGLDMQVAPAQQQDVSAPTYDQANMDAFEMPTPMERLAQHPGQPDHIAPGEQWGAALAQGPLALPQGVDFQIVPEGMRRDLPVPSPALPMGPAQVAPPAGMAAAAPEVAPPQQITQAEAQRLARVRAELLGEEDAGLVRPEAATTTPEAGLVAWIDGAINERERDNRFLEAGQQAFPGIRLGDAVEAGRMAYLLEKGEVTPAEYNAYREQLIRENRLRIEEPVRPAPQPDPQAKVWDALPLEDRVALAKKSNWTLQKDATKLTYLGRKIAESKWDDLSPAAKRILAKHLPGGQHATDTGRTGQVGRTEREGRDAGTVGDGTARDSSVVLPPEQAGLQGREGTVSHPAGDEAITYRVVEADSIVPSNNPLASFQKNQAYPYQNERAYHSSPAEQEKVMKNANPATFKPSLVLSDSPTAEQGAPVVDANLNVLGGNGRTMMLQWAYAKQPETGEAYKDALVSRAEDYGFDATQIQEMSRPVLVRMVDRQLSQAAGQKLIPQLNESFMQARDQRAEGLSRSADISPRSYQKLGVGLSGFDSLRQFFDSHSSRAFVESLVADEVIPSREKNRYVDREGLLNLYGKEYVERVLRGMVFDNYDVIDRLPPSLMDKIDRTLPAVSVLKLRGGEWDISGQYKDAIRLADQFVASGAKNLKIFLDQGSMLDADPAKQDPLTRAIFSTLADSKITQKKFAEAFNTLAAEAKMELQGQELMFAPKSFAEAVKLAFDVDIAPTRQAEVKSQPKPAAKAEKAKPETPRPAAETDKIEDFGEKIGGARKDRTPSLDKAYTDNDLAGLPLSEIWPKAEVDAIQDTWLAALATALRASVPAKPRKSYKVKSWVESVKLVRELMRIGQDHGRDFLMDKLKSDSRSLKHFATKIELLDKIDREHWDRIGKVENHPDALKYEWDKKKPDGTVDYSQGSRTVPSPYSSVEIDGRFKSVPGGDIIKNVAHVKELLDQGGQIKDVNMKFEVRGRPGSYGINKKGDPLYRRLKVFETSKEAFDFIKENHKDLVEEWENVKARDNVKETDVRRAENRERAGKDHRQGRDVTPEVFADVFGFRGVEFGNWVSQGGDVKGRQGMLNQAYDALMDLSEIIGVPPKAMSLNGTLGLAFGARGSGWGSAHYEPGKIVINLTKTRGAGSLAHEFFHALDHYFQRQRTTEGKTRDSMYITHAPENMYVNKVSGAKMTERQYLFVTENNTKDMPRSPRSEWELQKGVRPEVAQAFHDFVTALDNSPMSKRSKKMDKGRAGYWSRTLERAARAFEVYVIAKMQQGGYHNDYLVNVIGIDKFQRNRDHYPYLLESELAPIEKAFDDLFGVIETRETDTGVAMFARREGGLFPDRAPVSADVLSKSLHALIQNRYPGLKGRVVVEQSERSLPEALRQAIRDEDMSGRFYGLAWRGKIYVVGDNIQSRRAAEAAFLDWLLRHEGRHVAWNDIFGGQAKRRVFFQRAARAFDADVQAWLKNNAMANNPTNRAIAAEEVMADHARRGTPHRIVDELIAKIMEWARKLFPKLTMTKAEVRALLGRADQLIEAPSDRATYLGGLADARYARENVQAWPEGLEKAEVHTTVSALKKFAQYDAAKKGDPEAGLATAQHFIKPEKVLALKEQHPDAIVVFVHAEESAGRNTIPAAMAAVYKDAGFTVSAEIVQSSAAERTKKSSVLRLVSLPKFAGPVAAGGKYVLLDDVLGQGGTANELRHHIESNGGQVVAVHGLTAGYAATILPIKSTTVSALETKFGRESLEQFIQEYDIAGRIEAITEKQGRFILSQPSLDALRDRITQEKREGGAGAVEWQVEAPVREPEVTDPDTPSFARKPPASSAEMAALAQALRPKSAASEALNKGKPVNTMGLPVMDLVDAVEPDGTLDISQAKIDATRKSLLKLVGMIESAPDKLRRGKGLGNLAQMVENYFDTHEKRRGWINGTLRPVFKGLKDRKAGLATFEAYFRARENGRKREAAQILDSAPRDIKALIQAWHALADETGQINQSVPTPYGQGLLVYDGKIRGWRPIGKLQEFFPRSLRPEVQAVLQNPDVDPALWNSLVDALLAAGKIKDRAQAFRYISEYFTDEVRQDYFAGIEKARGEPLPEIFYDYSWSAAARYLNKWAQRISQVEHFGQQTGKVGDWFDINLPKIRDEHTKQYVGLIRDRIYNVRPLDIFTNIMNASNLIATGLQLGNPATAYLNWIGGSTLNVVSPFGGLRNVMRAYKELLADWNRVQQEGVSLGILGKDVLNILQDAELDAGKYFENKATTTEALGKFASFTMKWGGYKGTENIIRATGMLAAKSWLHDSLRAVNSNPKGRQAKRFFRSIATEHLDAEALIRENGHGPETAKFLRRAVNIPQGSYRIDMTPIFTDLPAGRFLFKYQKFGTQLSRMFWRHHLQPFLKSPKPDTFLPLARFFLATIGGGTLIAMGRAAMFGYPDPGPEPEDVKKALQNKDTARAWGLIFSRAWHSMNAAGAMGFFGNYIQFSLDWRDQQRVKNPLTPPGLASLDAIVELFSRGLEQSTPDWILGITGRDIDEIAEQTVAIFRAYKRMGMAGLDKIGVQFGEVRLFAARKERNYARKQARRYAKEAGIESRRQTPGGRWGKTPMSPANRDVANALLLGDVERARLIIKKQLAKAKTREERESMIASFKASARVRQPVLVAGAPSEAERIKFFRWAKKNLPAEGYERIRRLDRQYREGAQRIGLM